MKHSTMAKAAFAVVALIVMAAVASGGVPEVVAAASLSCSDAVSALIPCGSYLLGSSLQKPNDECCRSAQKLNQAADKPADRQALCECLKQTGPSFGVKPERAKLLPSFCKLQLKIPVSPTANCSQV